MENCGQINYMQLVFNDNVVAHIYPEKVEFHNQTIADIYKLGINIPDYMQNKWGKERISICNPKFSLAMIQVEFPHSLKSQGYVLREVSYIPSSSKPFIK